MSHSSNQSVIQGKHGLLHESNSPPPLPSSLLRLHSEINARPGDMEKEMPWNFPKVENKPHSLVIDEDEDVSKKEGYERWQELARQQEQLTAPQDIVELDDWEDVEYDKKQKKKTRADLSHGNMNDIIPSHHFFKNGELANRVLSQIYHKSRDYGCLGLVVKNLTGKPGDKIRRYRQLVIKEDGTQEKKFPHITFHAPGPNGDYQEGVVHIKDKKNQQILLTFVRESKGFGSSEKIWKVDMDGDRFLQFREIITILNCLLVDPNITKTLNQMARWLNMHRIFDRGGMDQRRTKKRRRRTKKRRRRTKKRGHRRRRKSKILGRKLHNKGKYLTRKLRKYL
jgi:hypothetical protein